MGRATPEAAFGSFQKHKFLLLLLAETFLFANRDNHTHRRDINALIFGLRIDVLNFILPKRPLVRGPARGHHGGMARKKRVMKQFRRAFIREWRKHRIFTLEQLASRLDDMAPSNLSMLERGLRGYTQDTLERIAEELQTDVASLLMRNPADSEALWTIWDQAKPGQRQQIVEIAETITRTGT